MTEESAEVPPVWLLLEDLGDYRYIVRGAFRSEDEAVSRGREQGLSAEAQWPIPYDLDEVLWESGYKTD